MALEEITALRRGLWFECGYRSIPLLSHTDPDKARAGKCPVHKEWQALARQTPPWAATVPAQQHLANTGLLADGLRLIDGDTDHAGVAEMVEELIIRHPGPAPTRRRSNSSRFAMLYAAADGSPGKRTLRGTVGRVEVLGHGQQFVAYGTHASGTPIVWPNGGPLDLPAEALPKVDEMQITTLLAAIAPIIGAKVPRANGPTGTMHGAEGIPADLSLIASALLAISVAGAGYDLWIKLGAALWHATSGSADGLALWDRWSAQSEFYSAAGIARRWTSFGNATTSTAGPGTIIWLARMHGWQPPAPEPDPAWLAAHPPVGAAPSVPALASFP
jgi:hypothetical protein